ncbi:hypothetical protein [Streptomyces sp. H39-S7]|uniref:hypothetical protein n=1 Tax=Streptomyces sp. H39-S7 TaxID=3004357 RepID=UPI0022AFF24D|nr:hypothetical protein [Streptomyces sp. H39-S7]MCZ4123386.1 hypothetical protein [Streptomyces sp. H39-S7]
MRNRIVLAPAAAMAMLTVLTGTATASPSDTAPAAGSGRSASICTDVRLSGSLPVPPAGMSAQQEVSVGADCVPHLGAVRLLPAPARSAVRTAATTGRQVRSWSEMYDCCNILMTALYTTTTWDTVDNQVSNAVTEVSTHNNREPWNAGWSVKTSGKTEAGAKVTAHAEFGYQGIFDATGAWYANTHDTAVQLNGDGTAACQFDIVLRHTFIGWNSVRGCS